MPPGFPALRPQLANKAVFWCLCGLTALLLVTESYGPENVIPYYDSSAVRHLRAPEIYFEFDDEPVSSINSSETLNMKSPESRRQPDEGSISIASLFPGIEPEPFNRSKLKRILVWNNGYGVPTEGLPDGDEHELDRFGCPQPNCVIVSKKNQKLPDHLYDAIIFHFRVTTLKDLPKSRTDKQRWIFRESEPASYVYQFPHVYDGMFNWTYTYRNDSDVVMRPYHVLPKTPAELAQPPSDLETRPLPKPKMAAWFVSNCNAHSGRDKIVRQLRKFVEVDIYGKCGTMKCSRADETACRRMLEENYKFYLAFENSLCRDYVTEKLFDTLNFRVVPVVYGSAEYAELAPPHSYINAMDFNTVEKLAQYLQYLAANDTAYNEYFQWRTKYKLQDIYSNRIEQICRMCYKLHNDRTHKVYDNLDKWFIYDSKCKRLAKQKKSLFDLFRT